MAKVIGGPFGLLSGKLGNRVYYIVNGKQRVRINKKNNKPPTKKQLTSRQCVKVLNKFLKKVNPFINAGFGPEADARSIYPQNVAFGYNRRFAMKGEYPHVEMDYGKVSLSDGGLNGLHDVTVVPEGNGEEGFGLRCSWTVGPADLDWPRCNDRLMMLAYFPDASDASGVSCGVAVYELTGPKRNAGYGMLPLPDELAEQLTGHRVEVYIAVVSEDRKQVSRSQYFHVALV